MGKIYGAGINQGDLVDMLVKFKTNFNAILAKLDLDAGVADTNYTSLQSITFPSTIKTSGAKAIRDQGETLTFLGSLITKFNAVLTKLDADAQVNDTNYNALWAITNTVGTKHLRKGGRDQGSLVFLLNNILTNINGLNAKLDLDAGVSGTNYGSLWNITDTVVESGTRA